MVLIEGIGDEVTVVCSAAVLAAIIALAWISTAVTERPISLFVIHSGRSVLQTVSRHVHAMGNAARFTESQETNGNQQQPGGGDVMTASREDATEERTTEQSSNVNSDNSGAAQFRRNVDSTLSLLTGDGLPVENSQTSKTNAKIDASLEQQSQPAGSQNCDAPAVGDMQNQAALPTAEVLDNSDGGIRICSSSQNEIRVRVKFALDDSERLLTATPQTTIQQFSSEHFSSEISAGKIIRLIYNGQVLAPPSRTLSDCAITNNTTVHCLVSNPPRQQAAVASQLPGVQGHVGQEFGLGAFHLDADMPIAGVHVDFEMDLSRLMLPLFGLMLVSVWWCRFQFQNFFNVTSSLCLLLVTVLYGLFAWFLCHTEDQDDHED